MHCSHCGAKMEKGFQYCPVCGTKADTSVKVEQKSEMEGEAKASLIQKKKMPFWFKLITFLATIALIGVSGVILFTERFVDVVNHHLDALRNNEIDKAYLTYTAKEYQATHNLNQFRNFIETYPVFKDNQTASFIQRDIGTHHVTLKGNLISKARVNTPIEYKLVKEDDSWKILSIRLRKPNMIPQTQGHRPTDELINLATDLLSKLRQDQLEQVYSTYFSKEYRGSLSEKEFVAFIHKYPLLEKYDTITFPKVAARKSVGTLGAILKEKDSEIYIKYYFIKENNHWKVLSMRILSPEEESVEELIVYGEMVFGSKADEHGLISKPAIVFPISLKKLYINLDIDNGVKGETINLQLQHEDGTNIANNKADIQENGDSILTAAFVAPEKGWSAGNYQIVVSASSGEARTYPFRVE